MGSRAVVDRLPRRRGGAAAVRRRRGRASASSTRAPAGGSSTIGRLKRACSTSCPRRMTAAGLWERVRDRLGLPRLRADALVGQGAGAAASSSMRRSGAAARGAAVRRSDARRCSWRAVERAARSALLAAISDLDLRGRSIVAAYRRYCWPVAFGGRPEARAVSPAGQRRAGPRRPETTSGTWRRWQSCASRRTDRCMATPYLHRRSDRLRRATAAGDRTGGRS